MAELLGTSPGVTLHATGGPGQASTLSLRGASADESLVLLDGIPLQGPGGGAIDLATLPASLLSTIVVSRGVLGAQLGAGALGGAVELFPRVPKAGVDAEGSSTAGSAQLEAGSVGTAQLAADLDLRTPGSGVLTAAVQLDRTAGDFAYQRQLTPDLPGAPWYEDQRANADSKRAGLLLHWAGHASPSLEEDAIFQGSAGDRGLPGPVGNFTPSARQQDEDGLLGARVRGLAGAAVWSVRAWGRADRIALQGVGAGFSDCPTCAGETSRFYSTRAEGEVGLPLGQGQWLSVSGSGGGEWIASDGTGRHRRGLASIAANDELRFFGGAVSLVPALRIDSVGDFLGWSPGLGATFQPWLSLRESRSALRRILSRLELRAGVGRSFRAASFSELYLDQGGLSPNPALQPERATSVDLGLHYRGESLTLGAGVFTSLYQNLIIYELYPPARAKPFNIGAARIAGVELEAVLQLPRGFTAEASYSYLDARNRRDSQTEGNQELPYRPPHRLFLRGARHGDRLEGFAELAFTSSMPRNPFGTATLPSYASINAGAGVRLVGTFWLSLEVRNLLDDQRQQDLFQYPLPGLTAMAVVRARL